MSGPHDATVIVAYEPIPRPAPNHRPAGRWVITDGFGTTYETGGVACAMAVLADLTPFDDAALYVIVGESRRRGRVECHGLTASSSSRQVVSHPAVAAVMAGAS